MGEMRSALRQWLGQGPQFDFARKNSKRVQSKRSRDQPNRGGQNQRGYSEDSHRHLNIHVDQSSEPRITAFADAMRKVNCLPSPRRQDDAIVRLVGAILLDRAERRFKDQELVPRRLSARHNPPNRIVFLPRNDQPQSLEVWRRPQVRRPRDLSRSRASRLDAALLRVPEVP
jgi:hypothetical protein